MSSLKGYIPALARILNTTAGALYERQRVLVRAGLLDAEDGRGPGSGVRATVPYVARLLISALASEGLSESAARTKALMAARPMPARRCPYTRSTSFGDALTVVLVSDGKAEDVHEIIVSRTADIARIAYYVGPGEIKVSEFAGRLSAEAGMGVSATINTALLAEIARDVRAITMDEEGL